jgi:hypothetical protein
MIGMKIYKYKRLMKRILGLKTNTHNNKEGVEINR